MWKVVTELYSQNGVVITESVGSCYLQLPFQELQSTILLAALSAFMNIHLELL